MLIYSAIDKPLDGLPLPVSLGDLFPFVLPFLIHSDDERRGAAHHHDLPCYCGTCSVCTRYHVSFECC